MQTTNKNFRAKKSFGQNFLKSEIALKKIVEAGEIKKSDIVLEIGPGKGALTEKLLATGCKVIAVEKDYELFELLKTKFEKEISAGTLVLVCEDILDFNIAKNIKSKKYKIIANIPYNITGAILKKFLTADPQPECMVLMIQHEVARRILAVDGKESILSISVKAYGEPKMIMKVDARYFSPAPKVNSAIIAIRNISTKKFAENGVQQEIFWEIVKSGFSHKRKKLSGNLKGVFPSEKLKILGFSDKRAEDLSLIDWTTLARGI